MSDSNGLMVFSKFDQFLKEVLKLPTAVFEGPSFGYTEHSVRTCFPQQVRAVSQNRGPRSRLPQVSAGCFSEGYRFWVGEETASRPGWESWPPGKVHQEAPLSAWSSCQEAHTGLVFPGAGVSETYWPAGFTNVRVMQDEKRQQLFQTTGSKET